MFVCVLTEQDFMRASSKECLVKQVCMDMLCCPGENFARTQVHIVCNSTCAQFIVQVKKGQKNNLLKKVVLSMVNVQEKVMHLSI